MLGRLELGTTERGWCDLCQLPSLLTGPVQILTDQGVSEVGTWRHCTNHDRNPDEIESGQQ